MKPLKIPPERLICILKNARNMAKKKRVFNWVLVGDLFGYGSGTSIKLCKDLEVDPDSYEI